MARKQNVIIIGAGLFGSIAAARCRLLGHNVTVVADQRPAMASLASGCVIAPSWLSSLSAPDIATAMGVLSAMYKVHDITFTTNVLGRPFKAQRVDLKSVLVQPDVIGKVISASAGVVKLEDGRTLRGKTLVSTGYWAEELVSEMPKVRGLWGASVSFKTSGQTPKLNVYAPYRQAVMFQSEKNRAWMGDGSALVTKTWDKESIQRMSATVERGRAMLSDPRATAITTAGVRPYVEGYKRGYFQQIDSSTWVSTGGAKNGTVLAALQAAYFTEALR
jgi:hypothetical protein